jgi:hypothetical protein
LHGWIELLGEIAGRGIREGDIVDHGDPEDIGRVLVSIYMGLRQASSLDAPAVRLSDFEKALSTVLRGIVQPDRIGYFTQFVKRRTAARSGLEKWRTPMRRHARWRGREPG